MGHIAVWIDPDDLIPPPDLYPEPKPLRKFLLKKLRNAKTKIDDLYPVRTAFNRFCPDAMSVPTAIKDIQLGLNREIMVFGTIRKDREVNENLKDRRHKLRENACTALNFWVSDDDDTIFAKIAAGFDNKRLRRRITGEKKAPYIVRGTCPKDFRMISVKSVRFVGMLG